MRVGSLPHGGTAIHDDTDTHISQVAFAQEGESATELIVHGTRFVGGDLYVDGLIHFSGMNLPAIDNGILGGNGREHTGVVDDAHHGVVRYLHYVLLRVEVLVLLSHLDLEAVSLTLSEDGVAEAVAVALVGIGEHLQ